MGEAQDDAAAAADGAPQHAPGGLIEQIGAEIDRRLDARLAESRLTGAAATGPPPDVALGATGSPREAPAAPGARSPWQSLWIGIMIGSAVTGAVAVVQGTQISNEANEMIGSPSSTSTRPTRSSPG